ncbi:hypothetical protein [Bradyrhizobium sp. WSM1253]|uniref:hypothetical protein n=1 Tax=Bradyrhizobium sp. WSM1253 TaxID=319003 RepID=UPI0012F48995|nr:hypothetical protein [Bradyrhizobium sp. WSM1253]
MKLSDFSSVLQLGVGLHLGTALLQSIAEFASSPLSKRIERLAKLAALRRTRLEKRSDLAEMSLELENEVLDLHSTLELRKVQFFNEYRIAAVVNTIAAVGLFCLLVWAAVQAEDPASIYLAIFLIGASFAPAVLSLGTLWWRWNVNTVDVRKTTAEIERKLLG